MRDNKKIVQWMFLVITSICVLMFSILYIQYRMQYVDLDCSNAVESFLEGLPTGGSDIAMQCAVDFPFDYFVFFSAYDDMESASLLAGCAWHRERSFGEYLLRRFVIKMQAFPEELQGLVFVRDEKVVASAIIRRHIGDFLSGARHKWSANEPIHLLEDAGYLWVQPPAE